MKTPIVPASCALRGIFCALISALIVFFVSNQVAHAQLFVANAATSTVGEYGLATGTAISANFITGLSQPVAIAVSGGNLFLANNANNTVGEYSLTTGTAVNSSFITGLSNPGGIAVSDSNLYVANLGANSVGEYSLTTGTAINSGFVTGLNTPDGIAVVPEPSTWSIIAIGIGSLLVLHRRR